ncbi:MAG: HDOD domain-containing protein [Rhodocyclaceae bacterium]|jgi:EAL and modified HD-GYP domain-containing signal transduction protein|nr:HDOD domain-containing protein [Rhodocyclaceae bacterium]
MSIPPSAPALTSLFLGRQPILDSTQALVGYQLLFRDSSENRAAQVQPGMATADVICKAFAELGLSSALGSNKVFVIVDSVALASDAIELLPANGVVFDLPASVAVEPAVVARCQALGQRGYTFCLNDLTRVSEELVPLLKQAMFVKLNLQHLPDGVLRPLLSQLADFRPLPIASHVETHADYERAAALGFHFFQGYYFAEPTVVEGKQLDPATQGLIRLIKRLNADADLDEIERIFKSEAALAVNLLRLTNSAAVGLRTRVTSVRQAITVLGRRQILRWLQLLLYSRPSGQYVGIERNPLMQLAAFKGNFMERLARRCYADQRDLPEAAFLCGLMSLMPAALGLPMTDIIEQIALGPQLSLALLSREGELGLLLDITDCYDSDDPEGAERVLAQMGGRINRETLNQCLAESIAWVQTLATEVA